jgi:hypothetical protein
MRSFGKCSMRYRYSGYGLVAAARFTRIVYWKTGKMELASGNETLEPMKHIDPNGEIIRAPRAVASFGDSA